MPIKTMSTPPPPPQLRSTHAGTLPGQNTMLSSHCHENIMLRESARSCLALRKRSSPENRVDLHQNQLFDRVQEYMCVCRWPRQRSLILTQGSQHFLGQREKPAPDRRRQIVPEFSGIAQEVTTRAGCCSTRHLIRKI